MKSIINAAATLLALASTAVSAFPLVGRQASPTTETCNITTSQLTANFTGNVDIFAPPYVDIQYYQLLYGNNSIYFGQARYELWTEPLIIDAESGFLSQHAAPTGFQFAYVYPGQTAPIEYTVPHGPVVPDGASQVGFNFTGNLWGVNGTTDKWVACPVTFSADGNWTTAQIYYQDGAVNKSCVPVDLVQFVYGNPGGNSNF
jgi:hypothetical protein